MTQADDFPRTRVLAVSISAPESQEASVKSISNRGFPFSIDIEASMKSPFPGFLGMLYAALGTYLVDKLQRVLVEMDIEDVVQYYYNSMLDRGSNADDKSIEAMKGALAQFKETYRDIPSRKFIVAMSKCMSFIERFPEARDFSFKRIMEEFYGDPRGNLDLWKYSRMDSDFRSWCEFHDYWFPEGKCVFHPKGESHTEDASNPTNKESGESHDQTQDHQEDQD